MSNNNLKTILFDMDGTLLNMGEHIFEKEYLTRMVLFLEKRFPGQGKAMVKLVGYGAEVMKTNDGSRANSDIFWEAFSDKSGIARDVMEPIITEYYQTDFTHIGDDYNQDQDMSAAVHLLDKKGYKLIVATTPSLPQIANKERLKWTGLEDIKWLDITSFEDYNYNKQNPKYYLQICEKFNLNPHECLMIGDSLTKDYTATEVGMDFYLMLNDDSGEAEKNFTSNKGTRKDLLEMVQSLPDLS